MLKVFFVLGLFISGLSQRVNANETINLEFIRLISEIKKDLIQYEFDDPGNIIKNKVAKVDAIMREKSESEISQLSILVNESTPVVLNLLGLGLRASRDYYNAFIFFEKALKAGKCTNDNKENLSQSEKTFCAVYYYNYANAYFLRGGDNNYDKSDIAESIKKFTQSTEYIKFDQSEIDTLASSYEQLGNAYTYLGQYDQARLNFRNARDLYKDNFLHPRIYRILMNQGRMLLKKAAYEKNMNLTKEALDSFKEAETVYLNAKQSNKRKLNDVYTGLVRSKVGRIDTIISNKIEDREEVRKLFKEVSDIIVETEKSKDGADLYDELYKVNNIRAMNLESENKKEEAKLVRNTSLKYLDKKIEELKISPTIKHINEKIHSLELEKIELTNLFRLGKSYYIRGKEFNTKAESVISYKSGIGYYTEGLKKCRLRNYHTTVDLNMKNIYLSFLEGLIQIKKEVYPDAIKNDIEEVVLQLIQIHDEPGYGKYYIIRKYIYLYKDLFNILIKEGKFEEAFILDTKRRALTGIEDAKFDSVIQNNSQMSDEDRNQLSNLWKEYNSITNRLSNENDIDSIIKLNKEVNNLVSGIENYKKKYNLNFTSSDLLEKFNINELQKLLVFSSKQNTEHLIMFSILSDVPFLFYIAPGKKFNVIKLDITSEELVSKVESLYGLINFDKDTNILKVNKNKKSEIVLNIRKNGSFQNINKYHYNQNKTISLIKYRRNEYGDSFSGNSLIQEFSVIGGIKERISLPEEESKREEAYKRIDSEIKRELKSLYNILFSKVDKNFKKDDRLIIIPDGILNYIPFSALINSEEKIIDELYTTQLNYSPLLWQDLRKNKSNNKNSNQSPLYMMGNPVHTSLKARENLTIYLSKLMKKINYKYNSKDNEYFEEKLCGLNGEEFMKKKFEKKLNPDLVGLYCDKGIQSEKNFKKFSDEILNLFYTENVNDYLLIGEGLSLNKLEELRKSDFYRKFSILHFSVHGYVDYSDFSKNSLLLTNPYIKKMENYNSESTQDVEDEISSMHLTSEDIQKWNTQAELIVLGACSTSIGPEVPGEGVMGLPYAFLMAGVGNAYSTLWKSIPRYSNFLLNNTYLEISKKMKKKEKIDYARELRDSRTKLRESFVNIRFSYWSLFVSYGD